MGTPGSLNCLFWLPLKLSDEQTQLYFQHFDGKWSEQTKEAKNRFKAEGLDLNENWALTPTFWSCPACGRSKRDIFRLTSRQILLAESELHHDHLDEVVANRAQVLLRGERCLSLPEGSSVLLKRICALVTRFSFALVCSECNAADGTVKTKLRGEIDPHFTFTVEEIRAFVTPRANDQHSLDMKEALRLWKAQKQSFFRRVNLIDQLLENVGTGVLNHCKSGRGFATSIEKEMTMPRLLVSAFLDEARGTERTGRIGRYRTEFLARSTSKDSALLLEVRSTRSPTVRAPTDDEYGTYVDPTSKKWQATPDNWRCPICDRQKRQIMRLSNKKLWSGSIRAFSAFTDETDEVAAANRQKLFPDFANDRMVGSIMTISVCSDCANVSTFLGQRERSLVYRILRPEDVRASITEIGWNVAHVIDFAIATDRARKNESYGPAMEAFRSFEARALGLATRYAIWRRGGRDHDAIMAEFSDEVGVLHNIDGANECRRLAEWLVRWPAKMAVISRRRRATIGHTDEQH
jgi:rubredoxin